MECNKILLIDFGTTYNKCCVYADGEFTQHEIISNTLWEISKEKAEGQLEKDKDSKLPVGLFTTKYMDAEGLTGHGTEVLVQQGAVIWDKERLTLGYKNTIEQLEHRSKQKILDNPDDWCVVSALALPETKEVQNDLMDIHREVLLDMGFKGVFLRSQVMFAIVGSIQKLTQVWNKTGVKWIVQILDIGGGDIKTCGVSKEPMWNTVRRESIGGSDVVEYARKILSEHFSVQIEATDEIQKELIESGNCDGQAEAKTMTYKGKEVKVQAMLNAPTMLFEPKKFQKQKQSITDVLASSLEAARLEGQEAICRRLIQCVLITGGGSMWNGIPERLLRELEERFPEYKGTINLIFAEDPQWVTLEGMKNQVKTKKEKNKELDWVAKKNESTE